MKVTAKDTKSNEETISTNTERQNTNKEDVNFDTLLSSAGELGRYQLLLLLSTCPFYLFGVNVYFSQLFMTEVPSKHWCWIPELANLTETDRRHLAIPEDDTARFGYSQCHVYDANWTEVLANGHLLNDTWQKVPCQHGWEFDRTEIPYSTISTDFEWVCDKSSYQATAQTIFFCGSVIGGILIGWIADRFGRIPAAMTSNVVACVGGLTSTYVTTFTQFSVCRFIMGMGQDNCMNMTFLIVLEYMAPRYRSVLANTTFAIFYSLFATTYPFVALACGHWKTLSLVSSIPMAFAILTPLFVPESPRWLLSKGRVDKAVGKILTIGRINRKEVPKKLIEQFKETVSREEKEESVSSLEIFKRPVLRKMLILVCLCYMCCHIVFDGLFRNLGQLEFDFFLSFAASSCTEFPSMVLCAFIMDYFGRRWLAVSMMIIASVFCVLTVFVGTGVSSVVCVVIARFVMNMACSTVLQWTTELFPTQVRGSGVSFVQICANIGIMVSPYITYLKIYIYWLPFVIIGGLSGVGALIAFVLPETAMKEMPHTFDDAEKLVNDQKLWEMPCLNRNRKESIGHVNQTFEM